MDNRILAFGAVERYKTEDAFSVIPISTFEYDNLGESFTHRVSRKRSSDLVTDIDYPDGVYILHETLGVRTVNEWNPENNDGVVGVLVVEDDHKIVVALEDAPEKWAEVIDDVLKNFKKKDTYEIIVNAGFDIKENAKWLKDFYVEALKEAGENN